MIFGATPLPKCDNERQNPFSPQRFSYGRSGKGVFASNDLKNGPKSRFPFLVNLNQYDISTRKSKSLFFDKTQRRF